MCWTGEVEVLMAVLGGVAGSVVTLALLCLLMLLLLGGLQVKASPVAHTWTTAQDEPCDFTVWDDNGDRVKGVKQVLVSCLEGRINWKYPHGALRVTLHPEYTDYEACFKAKSHYAITKISVEENSSSDESPEGSTVQLRTMAVLDKTHSEMENDICIESSSREPVTLYIEIEKDIETPIMGHVEIDYDLHKRDVKLKYGEWEVCRPCTDEEIRAAVCTSDFVLQGSMGEVIESEEESDTEIRVLPSKVIRQKHKQFLESRNTDFNSKSHPHKQSQAENQGSIYMPKKCGVKKGSGQFLFVGRQRLGRALLQCAPRLEDFVRLWSKAISQGLNPCVLN